MEFFGNLALGFCWWDLPALILLIAIAALFFVKKHKLDNEKKELQNQMSE